MLNESIPSGDEFQLFSIQHLLSVYTSEITGKIIGLRLVALYR